MEWQGNFNDKGKNEIDETKTNSTEGIIRVGFWQNGFFADFHFWAAGFFCGFSRRIFSPHFCGQNAQKNPPGKSPAKSSKNYTTKMPDTCLQRGRAKESIENNHGDIIRRAVFFGQRRHDRLYLHGPHPRKTMVWNHGLHPLRTMVLKSLSATTSMFVSIARCQGGDFQDHGSEGAQTMVPDHGFAWVGTMQAQAIMPPLIWALWTHKPRNGLLRTLCGFQKVLRRPVRGFPCTGCTLHRNALLVGQLRPISIRSLVLDRHPYQGNLWLGMGVKIRSSKSAGGPNPEGPAIEKIQS